MGAGRTLGTTLTLELLACSKRFSVSLPSHHPSSWNLQDSGTSRSPKTPGVSKAFVLVWGVVREA